MLVIIIPLHCHIIQVFDRTGTTTLGLYYDYFVWLPHRSSTIVLRFNSCHFNTSKVVGINVSKSSVIAV